LVSFDVGTKSLNCAKFRQLTKFEGEIYLDVQRNVYNAMGCRATGNALMGLKTAFTKARGFIFSGNLSGDVDQQGGAFVIGPEGDILYQHIDEYAGEFEDFTGLLSACEKYQSNSTIKN